MGYSSWKALSESVRTNIPSESDEVLSDGAELAACWRWQATRVAKALFADIASHPREGKRRGSASKVETAGAADFNSSK
jgi:hypothetical protein